MTNNLNDVLSQLITLTSERDTNSLELTMVQTLFNLAAPGAVVIYRVVDAEKSIFSMSQMTGVSEWKSIAKPLQKELIECIRGRVSRSILLAGHAPMLLYPVLGAKNQPLAVVALESFEDQSECHQVATMLLDIYKNFISLMNDNERDALTGLLNRKTFDLKINNIIKSLAWSSQRQDDENRHPYFLAIFDIDHFKRVNDTFGHLLGDEVLLLFSRLMAQTFRERDELFRFGGEEFIGVFQCSSEVEVEKILERFRASVEAYAFPQLGQITVSTGYTKIMPFDMSSIIIDRADAALYFAKNNGRNQVCSHEQLILQGKLEQNSLEGEIELF